MDACLTYKFTHPWVGAWNLLGTTTDQLAVMDPMQCELAMHDAHQPVLQPTQDVGERSPCQSSRMHIETTASIAKLYATMKGA